jgi:hypothetical protein
VNSCKILVLEKRRRSRLADTSIIFCMQELEVITTIVEAQKVHPRDAGMIWVEEGDDELDRLSSCVNQSFHAFP